ncbi:MAG: hypothetical protein WC536_04200 [Patescibacteria group bacterium]
MEEQIHENTNDIEQAEESSNINGNSATNINTQTILSSLDQEDRSKLTKGSFLHKKIDPFWLLLALIPFLYFVLVLFIPNLTSILVMIAPTLYFISSVRKAIIQKNWKIIIKPLILFIIYFIFPICFGYVMWSGWFN